VTIGSAAAIASSSSLSHLCQGEIRLHHEGQVAVGVAHHHRSGGPAGRSLPGQQPAGEPLDRPVEVLADLAEDGLEGEGEQHNPLQLARAPGRHHPADRQGGTGRAQLLGDDGLLVGTGIGGQQHLHGLASCVPVAPWSPHGQPT
jgi:hypothetical protein